jgi:DNA-binding PadR family transcriptional regulator
MPICQDDISSTRRCRIAVVAMTSKPVCACEGHTLDRLLQPAVMAFLAEGPQHGYALVERLKDSPLMQGTKPNDTGVYRLLSTLDDQGLVAHQLAASDMGPGKRVYELTAPGRKCVTKWINTLDGYQRSIAELVDLMRKTEVNGD